MKSKFIRRIIPVLLCIAAGFLAACNESTANGGVTSDVPSEAVTTPDGPPETTTDVVETTTEAPEAYNYIDDVGGLNLLFENGENCFAVSDEEVFSDLSAELRGGHMGHALVEYADGCLLGFYPNCNSDNFGHSGRGWMEYKRSTDYGETWSEPVVFEHSYKVYTESGGKRSVMCEKAVLADDGSIVMFLLNCDVDENALWEPYFEPEVVISRDGGESWSEPYKLDSKMGRVYSAKVIDGIIYALVNISGEYIVYISEDNGKSFRERGSLSGVASGSYYGTLEQLADGSLIAYTYHPDDETRLQYYISTNMGRTWHAYGRGFFENKLRNPQLVKLNGSYFMFGRSGTSGDNYGSIIVYCSKNGTTWDSGHYLKIRTAGFGAYSNVIVVGTLNKSVPDFLIFHSSHAYNRNLTMTYMWKIHMYVLKS